MTRFLNGLAWTIQGIATAILLGFCACIGYALGLIILAIITEPGFQQAILIVGSLFGGLLLCALVAIGFIWSAFHLQRQNRTPWIELDSDD